MKMENLETCKQEKTESYTIEPLCRLLINMGIINIVI